MIFILPDAGRSFCPHQCLPYWTCAHLCSEQRLGKSRSVPGTKLALHEEVVSAVTPFPVSAAAAAIPPQLSCC